MPNTNKRIIKDRFNKLEKKKKHLVLYRVLLFQLSEIINDTFPEKDKYLKVMFFLLSIESFFLRGKEISHNFTQYFDRKLDRIHAPNRRHARARDLEDAIALDRKLDRTRDLVLALDLARDAGSLSLDRAVHLALDRSGVETLKTLEEEISFVEELVTGNIQDDALYLDNIIFGQDTVEPFENLLYDKSADQDFIDSFYRILMRIDIEQINTFSFPVLKKYINQGLEGTLEKLSVARVIVLGNGSAGKTSLVKKLINNKYKTENEKVTPRIEISHDRVNNVEVDYWDFGGQVMMHDMHTFFMTYSATYVIVCNARADEQPDRWLETLGHTLAKNSKKINVLIVYSHIDTKEELGAFSKKRKHTLQRKFGEQFALSYHLHSSSGNLVSEHKKVFKVLKDKLDTCIQQEGSRQTFKEVYALYKEAEERFISAREIREKNKYFIEDDGSALVKALLLQGYIFPVKPLKDKMYTYIYNETDRFVWQKHWLTYGVYEIINHDITKDKSGYVSKSYFKEMLFDGEPRYILKDGSLDDKEPSKKPYETIVYDDEGIELFYEIVQNYKLAITNAQKREELIFPHAVSLDEPAYDVLEKYTKEDAESIVVKILFDYVPVGFFFRFVTLADTHIHEPSLLWRDGVVLFDQMDKESFAYIQMHQSKIDICINGENKNFLLQFLLYYLAMLVRDMEKKQSYIPPKILKRIKVDDRYMMIDVDLMTNLSDEETRNSILKSVYEERTVIMKTFNLNFNDKVDARGAAIGNENTVNNYNTTVNYLEKTKEILETIDDDDNAKELIIEADTLIQEQNSSPNWREKVGNFKDKVVGYAKDLNVLNKAGDAIGEAGNTIAQSEIGQSLIELGEKINF